MELLNYQGNLTSIAPSESDIKLEFDPKYSSAATSSMISGGSALNVNDSFQSSSLSYAGNHPNSSGYLHNYLEMLELDGNSFTNTDYYDSYNYMFSNIDSDHSSCHSSHHSHSHDMHSAGSSSVTSELSHNSPLNSPFNASHTHTLKAMPQSNYHQYQGMPSNAAFEFQQQLAALPEAQEVDGHFQSSSSAASTSYTDSFSIGNESPIYPVNSLSTSTQSQDIMNYPDITTYVNSNMHIAVPMVESTFVDHRICRVCGKRINRDMSRHMRTHQAISRFTCKFPNQCRHRSGKFNRPYDFKKHLLNRHFRFDDIQIKRKNNLNEKLDHWGTCLCGTRFLAKDWLDEHILTNDKKKRCSFVE